MSYAHCLDKEEEDLRDQVWEPWVIPALTSPSAPNLDPQNSPCPIHLKGSQHARQPNNAIISPSLFQQRCSASVCRARAHLGCTCGEGNKQTHNCWSWFWRWGWKGLFPWLNQRGSSIWAKPELEWKYQTSGYRFFLLYPCSFLPPREKTNNNRSKTTNNLRFNTRR